MRTKYIAAALILALALFIGPVAAYQLDSSDSLSLELEAVPITMVLQMIAQQNDLNLLISGDISGEVTLRLYQVALPTALDAILSPNGYNYYLKDDIIVVKSSEIKAPGELISQTVRLKYLNPVTAQKALEAQLSARGNVVILDQGDQGGNSTDGYRANRIMITDFPAVVTDLVALVSEIDQPERMVSIEVRIIESTVDNKTKLGFSWPTTIQTSLGGDNSTGSSSESSGNNNPAGQVDLNAETLDWTWGTLSVAQLGTVLDLLNQNGNSKLVSNPHITTLENHTAEIRVQTIIPIATLNRFTEGAAVQDIITFQDEEVGISLSVTPRITGDGNITMEVHPKVEDIIGYTGPIENQKPITASRSISTTITVANGETAALGGLLKEGEIVQVQRVPLLGRIPVLGKLLFSNKSTEKTTTDLIILITPHIMP
ncbi:MAG: hypothetical protein ABII79_05705 [bacterium]